MCRMLSFDGGSVVCAKMLPNRRWESGVRHDLERLGPHGFQDCAAALAIRALGAHVRPMGRGRDGGRDMLANGAVVWSANDQYGAEAWDGVTVFQVKHKATLEGPRKDAAWVRDQIRAELVEWSDPETERGEVPNYLVFVTNVPLTPTQDRGGFDTVVEAVQKYLDGLKESTAEDHLSGPDKIATRNQREARRDRMRNLRNWRIWDGYQIDGLLAAYEGVRRAFDGFLTAGDVLADLGQVSIHLKQNEIGGALRDHARWALVNERNVYFDEAGGETKGVPVEQVAVDLPVLVEDGATERVIRYTLDHGDRMLKPTITTHDKPRHLVIVGAPGNGKTTVSKFLVHAYRAALVGESDDLGHEHQAAVNGTKDALTSMGRGLPASRRWPIRVDLAKFAIAQATNEDYTLLHWIAGHLTRQVASKDVPRWALWKWLQTWPSFIILDGLDEVTEPSVRKTLVADVEAFVAEAETKDADMLVLVTTRPTGYVDDMPSNMFSRIDLADLAIDDALAYGRRVASVRIPRDKTRRDGVVGLLQDAAKDDALKHLLRTPLQVLIMTIIAETSRQFSPSRYALFWGYYKVVEQREQTKELGYSALLRDYAQVVLDLHRRVGLTLQQHAETATGADSVMLPEELRDTAWRVLKASGYDPSNADKGLLDQIVTAATHRIVLITPQPGGGYGYEVRSLQELMAALALTTGTVEESIPKLRRISASPHWRNTLLFAAGRYFSEPQPHQKDAVTNLVLTIDDNAPERLGAVVPVGPALALEIVDDGMASEPIYLHPLVTHSLKLLEAPEPQDGLVVASRFAGAVSLTSAVSTLIADGFRAALGGDSVARDTAASLQRWFGVLRDFHPKYSSVNPNAVALDTVKRNQNVSLPPEPVANWAEFHATVNGYADDENRAALNEMTAYVENMANAGARPQTTAQMAELLSDPNIAFVCEAALIHVADGCPLLVGALRDAVMPILWRRQVEL